MNLQARLTESLKASQSALRVISQLQAQLASAKAEIERKEHEWCCARKANKDLITENKKLEAVRVAAENIREIDHGCEKGDTDYCCYQYQDADISLRNALAAAKEGV